MSYGATASVKVATYRGVDVFVNQYQRFNAGACGQNFNAGAFDTLRKKLDAAISFEQFQALILEPDGVEQVLVVGVNMDESEWILDGPAGRGIRRRFYLTLYPLELRDKLEAFLGECEQWDKIESDIKEARDAMRQGLDA